MLLVDLGTSNPNLQVLGGDALYTTSGYPLSAKIGFSRLRFTAFAYPDEWDILGLSKAKPQFFDEYKTDFNPQGADHSANPYGFTRPDYGVMLSYDAMYALFQGTQNVLDAKNALTSTALQGGLTQISGTKAIQGVSGQIRLEVMVIRLTRRLSFCTLIKMVISICFSRCWVALLLDSASNRFNTTPRPLNGRKIETILPIQTKREQMLVPATWSNSMHPLSGIARCVPLPARLPGIGLGRLAGLSLQRRSARTLGICQTFSSDGHG